jgi:hypothetical protein
MRRYDNHFPRESGPRSQDRLKLSAFLEPIHPPYRGNDPLPALAILPTILHQLKIASGTIVLLTKEHLLSPQKYCKYIYHKRHSQSIKKSFPGTRLCHFRFPPLEIIEVLPHIPLLTVEDKLSITNHVLRAWSCVDGYGVNGSATRSKIRNPNFEIRNKFKI